MEEIFKVLDDLNISYDMFYHKPVFTAEEAEFILEHIEGVGCKNLFLKDKEHHFYLGLIESKKRGDLKTYAQLVNTSKLTFASEEDLMDQMKLSKGSVTPLGLIHDTGTITVLIDKDLLQEKVLMHPLVNTCTISMDCKDLLTFIEHCGNSYLFF